MTSLRYFLSIDREVDRQMEISISIFFLYIPFLVMYIFLMSGDLAVSSSKNLISVHFAKKILQLLCGFYFDFMSWKNPFDVCTERSKQVPNTESKNAQKGCGIRHYTMIQVA